MGSLRPFLLLVLFVLVAQGCSSPRSGLLIINPADGGSEVPADEVADENTGNEEVDGGGDTVGDDDDAVGDDDDAMGDDDDPVEDSPLAGPWDGFMGVINEEQTIFFCEGESQLDVSSAGEVTGVSVCALESAGGPFVDATFEHTGSFDADGAWRGGEVTISFLDSVQQVPANGGIVSDRGGEVLALAWRMTLNIGGSPLEVIGVVNAYR